MDSIELSLFVNRISSVCNEMGAILQTTAFSPNIKDRLDFSCAIFDHQGALCAQAAHIPVHLGSMAYAMSAIVERFDWQEGDILIVNDPFLGGTHLPDITIISPVFYQNHLIAFAANRAHYADIGSDTPGSMPVATKLNQEGLIISPTLLQRNGQWNSELWKNMSAKVNNPELVKADLTAQINANQCAEKRLHEWIGQTGNHYFRNALNAINDYAETLAFSNLQKLQNGIYTFTDVMDDDGQATKDIPITVRLTIEQGRIEVDFTGTSKQVTGNINCPLSVTAAAVYYCFYALMPEGTPACHGSFRSISLSAPEGSLVNASAPAAVAAGNVETSSRIVDVVLGALFQAIPDEIPAASQGTMNNIAMGNVHWDYYETLAGGMGANACSNGLDAVQTHMTNTANTPVEVLETYYPLRIHRYALRNDSGGCGRFNGGNGVIREYEFLETTSVSILSERRQHEPWGIAGGSAAVKGENIFNGNIIPAKTSFTAEPGDRLIIQTPGGGGWGDKSG